MTNLKPVPALSDFGDDPFMFADVKAERNSF